MRESTASQSPCEKPFLVIAAFWLEGGDTDAVAEALRQFEVPDGYPRGAVVGFRHEVATSYPFYRDLRRFDLADAYRDPREPERVA